MKLHRLVTLCGSPFEARIAAALPRTAWLAGLVLAISLTTVGLVLHSLSGTALFVTNQTGVVNMTAQFHVTLLCSALLAYGLTAARVLRHPLDPGTGPTAKFKVGALFAGMAGLLTGAVVIIVTARQMRIQEPDRNPWTPGEIYVDLLALLLLWGIARASYFTLRGAGASGAREAYVDLFDLTPLHRYGHRGLKTAMAWSGGISLLVLIMFFDPNPTLQIDSIKILGPVLMASMATAGLSLYQPLRILRERVREEKSHAIKGVHDRLVALRAKEAAGIPTVPGTESDLLARRAFLLSLPEWMLETGGFRKFAVYVLFPIGSWFLGPLLRKLLDGALLDGLARSVREWLY